MFGYRSRNNGIICKSIASMFFSLNASQCCIIPRLLLLLINDIESNPGSSIKECIFSHSNVRSLLANDSKLAELQHNNGECK